MTLWHYLSLKFRSLRSQKQLVLLSPAAPDVIGGRGWRNVLMRWQNSARSRGWGSIYLGNPGLGLMTLRGSAKPRAARLLCAGMDHAGSGVAQDIELAVGVLNLERDRPRRFCRGATNLGQLELYPMRNVDAHPMLLTSRRAHDWSPVRLKHTRDHDPRSTPLDVDLELNRPEQRRVNRARHGVEHPPVRLGLFGLATMANRDQGFALTLVGALVNDGLHRAPALKDGAWPGIQQGKVEAIQR